MNLGDRTSSRVQRTGREEAMSFPAVDALANVLQGHAEPGMVAGIVAAMVAAEGGAGERERLLLEHLPMVRFWRAAFMSACPSMWRWTICLGRRRGAHGRLREV